jgi:integrase
MAHRARLARADPGEHAGGVRPRAALVRLPRFGDKPVTAISRADVRDLLVDLMAKGKSRGLARNLLAPVRQTFNQLIDDGVLASNPASRMGPYLKPRTDPRGEIAFLLPDEEEVLLAAALKHAPRYYPLLLCALRTGLRVGELFGLQWDDVRFHDVRHTFASRLLQNGESPAYVKEQMGHSSIKITVDTYGHLIPGSNKAAVDRLDTTGRNPRATAPDKHARDAAVSGGSNWLPGLGSNQRLPD